jgi:hypothetical protein
MSELKSWRGIKKVSNTNVITQLVAQRKEATTLTSCSKGAAELAVSEAGSCPIGPHTWREHSIQPSSPPDFATYRGTKK